MVKKLFFWIDPTLVFIGIFSVFALLRPTFHVANTHKPESSLEKNTLAVSSDAIQKKQGIDVSHFQGVVDWKAIKNNVDYVYVKATDGITYVDPRYYENSQALTQEKIHSGAYHFYEPDDDPIKQADNFLSTTGSFSHRLRPVLDVEISRGKSANEISAAVLKWLEYVTQKTGCKPIVYSYASFWDEYLGKSFSNYPFWLADYTAIVQPPADRADWQLWQYSQTGRIDGIAIAVDRDIFQGDVKQFNDLFCP